MGDGYNGARHAKTSIMITVSCAFDAGAIEVVSVVANEAIELRVRRDSHQDFRQWFYFRVQGARDSDLTMRLTNAAQCTYPKGWEDYRAVASYDREAWFRVPTEYRDGVLTIRHAPQRDSVYYAYFEPFSWERHLALVGRAARDPFCRIVRLGESIEGRDLDMLSFSRNGARLPKVWIIARQHPGETMAEWFVEGLVERLLDGCDGLARVALSRAEFHIVPNMNPDGSVHGNLRTNAAGANLNREWIAPSIERSPEVFHVRNAMLETGVDLFLDVHGDEALPYVFVAGSEMLPSYSERQRSEQAAFVGDFLAAAPDFQTEFGYAPDKYNADALKLASKWVGDRFDCLSLTLEMPFKDNANLTDELVGWDGRRSAHLGAAILSPIVQNLCRRAS